MWRDRQAILIVLTSVVLAISCSGEKSAAATPDEKTQIASAGTLSSMPTSATLSGTVRLEGTSPPPQPVAMTPECQAEHTMQPVSSDVVINSASQLSNVLVYVKDYHGAVPKPREAIAIEDNGCQIEPHVTAAMAGQAVTIRNADKLGHQLRVAGAMNGQVAFDPGQAGDSAEHVFSRPELMMKVSCAAHPWESAYLSIMPNPFFSVTGSDGGYVITDVPPGTYTLEAVHEKFGVIDQQVTVGANEQKPVSFTFHP